MSFVPTPQQANAAGNASNNALSNGSSRAASAAKDAAAAAAAEPEMSDADILFKMRTYDLYWVDKTALMYRDGFAKVRALCRLWTALAFCARTVNSQFWIGNFLPYY